jgi:uncharacterized protein YoxC
MDFTKIFNSGTAIAMLIFFMYFITNTMKDMTIALNNNTQVMKQLQEDFKILREGLQK